MHMYTKQNFPNDPITRCYIKCFMETFNLFDSKSGFKPNNLLSHLQYVEVIRPSVLRCGIYGNNRIMDTCSSAYLVFMCLVSEKIPMVMKNQ